MNVFFGNMCDLVQSVPYFGGVFICEKGVSHDVLCKYIQTIDRFGQVFSTLSCVAVSRIFKHPPQICIFNATEIGNALRQILFDSSQFVHPSSGLDRTATAGFAILMEQFSRVNDLVHPFMVVIQTIIPTIAFGPYSCSLVGYGMLPKTGFDHYYGGISHRISLCQMVFGIAIKIF